MLSGIVTYTGFKGAYGHTIIITSSDNTSITYSHLASFYMVQNGQSISKGDLISQVGPKNVYDVINNPYKDSNGNPTNGSTTGPHLHLGIKKDGIAVNPLNYFN